MRFVEIVVLVALLVLPQVVRAEETDEEDEGDETPVVEAKPAAPKMPAPKKWNVVYAVESGTLVPLETARVQFRLKDEISKRGMFAVLTGATMDTIGLIEGPASLVRLKSKNPTFVVKAASPALPGLAANFVMFPLKSVRQHREFRYSSMKALPTSMDHSDTAALNKVAELEMEDHPTVPGAVVLTPTKPLAPGEYVIQNPLSEAVSCFSIGKAPTANERTSGE